MGVRAWAGVVLVVLGLAAAWIWVRDRPAAVIGVVPAPAAVERDVALPRAELPAPLPGVEREGDPAHGRRAQAAAPTTPTPVPVPRVALRVVGRALDVGGAPLAGVEIRAAERPEAVLARSAGDGGFEFETELRHLRLEGARAGYATVRSGIVSEDAPQREALVVLAPAVDLAGRVVDPAGEGLAEAVLDVHDDWQGLIGFPLPLDGTEMRTSEARSGADGAFEFVSAPRLPGRKLRVRRAGFEAAWLEMPEFSTRDLEIRLEPRRTTPDPERVAYFGVVTFPDGTPAAGATVRLAGASTSCDRDGRFELVRAGWTADDVLLVALLEGWQPAIWGEIGPPPEERPASIGPLGLVLPGPSLSLAGRLELADGTPASGWNVRLLDPTVLDANQTPPPTAETLGQEFSGWARTDERGRFELTGLAERDYRLRLWEPETYVCLETGPIRAGTRDLRLRVPADAVLERLRGRVVTRGGVPVSGARIGVQFITSSTKTGFVSESVAGTESDAEGRFELPGLPRRHVNLVVGGDDLVWTTFPAPAEGFDGSPIVVEVERLARVRLDFSAADPLPDAFSVLDADGMQLQIESRSAGGRTTSSSIPLHEGRSAVLAVSESATTLVLRKGGREIARRALLLLPGEINELAP